MFAAPPATRARRRCLGRSRRSHRVLSALCAALAVTAMALLPGELFRGEPAAHPHVTPLPSLAAAGHPAAAGPPPVRDAGQDPAPRARAVRATRHPAVAAPARPGTPAPSPKAPAVQRVDFQRAPARAADHRTDAKPRHRVVVRRHPAAAVTPADGPSSPASAAAIRSTAQRRIADAVLAVLNQERVQHGRTRLRMNAKLIDSAHGHNLRMARQNTMSHQLPGEPYFATRIEDAGYDYDWAGENVGWNSEMSLAGVLALEIEMFDELPPDDGHRQNILSAHFSDVGIDVYFDNVNHKVWLTEDFGHPR